jgi:alginate O-acetyltransferase complex protein AlgI
MLFNTLTYLFIFLPICFLLFFYVFKEASSQNRLRLIVLFSLIFYSIWNVSLIYLFIGSILFNWYCSKLMDIYQHKKRVILAFGIASNVLILAYYKYFNFFSENINNAIGEDIFVSNVVLPLAISFYTIQQIAYLVDYSQGVIKYQPTLTQYSSFVAFFPQLIAGPIVHYKVLSEQFSQEKTYSVNSKNISLGLLFLSIGIFKKVALGDSLAPMVSDGYMHHEELNFLTSWLTIAAFYFQIYFDFSGYADMAIGSALLFNIKLPINFNSPYKSASLIEFWSRWHITLSKFINYYLYIPLLRYGRKVTFLKAMVVTLFAMFVSGIWHGAGWGFLIWGLLHGIGLIINHLWVKYKFFKLKKIFGWLLTSLYVAILLVFFRAETFDVAFNIISTAFGYQGITLPLWLKDYLNLPELGFFSYGTNLLGIFEEGKELLFLLALSLIIIIFFKNSNEIAENFKPSRTWVVFLALVAWISLLFTMNGSAVEFIYYEF